MVCVFCSFILFLSVFFVSQEGLKLVQSNDVYKWVIFEKQIHFRASKSTYQWVTHLVYYTHMCVSVYWTPCVLMCVCLCVRSNQSTSKNHVINILLHEMQQGAVGTKVPRLNKFKSIISLSIITYWMWHDPTFSQRNKATKKWERGRTKSQKRWCMQYRALHKIRGVRNLLPTSHWGWIITNSGTKHRPWYKKNQPWLHHNTTKLFPNICLLNHFT